MTSPKSAPVRIRNKVYGSEFRLIRTASRGSDLYWVAKLIVHTGEAAQGTSWISVDLWATGEWEVVDDD